MSELGEYWRDVKPILKEEKQNRSEKYFTNAMKTFEGKGYDFEIHPNTYQIVIACENGVVVDFWSSTGTWIERKTKERGRGIKGLMSFVDKQNA